MAEQSQNISVEQLGQIVDNADKKYTIGKQDYLLLIKKQKDKDYSTLYITDCQINFWVKKIDHEFFDELRHSLHVNSSLRNFSTHFIVSLKKQSKLELTTKGVKLSVELEIGEGLVMNCSALVQNKVSAEDEGNNFRMILKIFFKQLYQAKERQNQMEKHKLIVLKNEYETKLKKQKQGINSAYVKDVLLGNSKKAEDVKPKNRSLMNPNQKKRKNVGFRLGINAEGQH